MASRKGAIDASLLRLACAVRLLCAAALLFLTLMTPQPRALQTALSFVLLALGESLIQSLTAVPAPWLCASEAAATGLLIGADLPATATCMPYLLIAPLVAGCLVGIRSVLFTVVTGAFSVQVAALLIGQQSQTWRLTQLLLPWLVTSIGIGLVGARLSAVGPIRRGADASYESARRAIGQLRSLAGRLPAGLDFGRMAEDVLVDVDAALSPRSAAVLIQNHNGELVPLAWHGPPIQANLDAWSELVTASWDSRSPIRWLLPESKSAGARQAAAIPLVTGHSVVGAVLTLLSEAVPQDELSKLVKRFDGHALRLEAALAFEEVRRVATAQERWRLAAEIHDSIAQDAAALAYIVDDLAVGPVTTDQDAKLTLLRNELDRLLAELRLSIHDLRDDPTVGSLSEALLRYVARVQMHSAMRIHCAITGSEGLLPPYVEEQFLRVAQEAVTNARKHSGGSNVWIRYQAEPSSAQLVIEDDGNWTKDDRSDAFGLRLIRERAERIGAHVSIGPGPVRGTRVVIRWHSRTRKAFEGRDNRVLASTASR